MTNIATRGRPLASSREMLQEAAFELFLENTYARTSIDQITQRAGVSRATFFNYFPAKSDVFWIDLDESLARLGPCLAARTTQPVMTAVVDALLDVARDFGPARVPWALTHYALIGSVHELQASAMSRLATQARLVSSFVSGRGVPDATARAAAYAVLGAAVAAAQDWAAAGTTRGELEPYLRAALGPVASGFAA